MKKYEVRIKSKDGEWTNWAPANNNDAIDTLFNSYLRSIQYEYTDGSLFQYRVEE